MAVKGQEQVWQQDSPRKVEDCGPEWYDFGNGMTCHPTSGLVNSELKSFTKEHIAALVIVRSGKFYFHMIEFDLSEGDTFEGVLAQYKEQILPGFLADVERLSTQETQNGNAIGK